jgi:hypothetical protein
MRAPVRVSHRGWKMATRIARLAIGVPDYEACLLRLRDEDGTGATGMPPSIDPRIAAVIGLASAAPDQDADRGRVRPPG